MILKQTFRSPARLLTAAVLFAVCFSCFAYQKVTRKLPCAVYSEDAGEKAQAFVDSLLPYGFERCASREEAQARLEEGTADCALIVLDGLENKIASGGFEGACQMLVTSRSAESSSYSAVAAGLLFRTFSLELTVLAFDEKGCPLDQETAKRLQERANEAITPLEFEIEDLEGKALAGTPRYLFPTGCVAIALFLSLGLLSVTDVRRSSCSVRSRFSPSGFYTRVLLPRLGALALLLGAAACLGVCAGRLLMDFPLGRMLLAVLGYTVLLTVLFSLLLLLPVSDQFLVTALALNALISLALCPMYLDFTLRYSQLSGLRALSVPYWLYVFMG